MIYECDERKFGSKAEGEDEKEEEDEEEEKVRRRWVGKNHAKR